MQVKRIIMAPAKINIFLKILGKRNDGYHEIKSGITFINLNDQVKVEVDKKNSILYSGNFKPKKGFYEDCIIKKTLNFLNIDKNIKLKVSIIKNIPVQGGLGSGSTNAAALIQALESMSIIKVKSPNYYSSLGADIPFFLFKKDCIVTGMGEKLNNFIFPKYFFLLVKPKFNNSTKDMYKKLQYNNQYVEQNLLSSTLEIDENDTGNDFEKITIKENIEYREIINSIDSLEHVIFTRMTGSGSCCYGVFDKKEHALKNMKIFKRKFPELWINVCENNINK